jgi:hypothetical protein
VVGSLTGAGDHSRAGRTGLGLELSGVEALDHVHDEALLLWRDVAVGSGDAP